MLSRPPPKVQPNWNQFSKLPLIDRVQTFQSTARLYNFPPSSYFWHKGFYQSHRSLSYRMNSRTALFYQNWLCFWRSQNKQRLYLLNTIKSQNPLFFLSHVKNNNNRTTLSVSREFWWDAPSISKLPYDVECFNNPTINAFDLTSDDSSIIIVLK